MSVRALRRGSIAASRVQGGSTPVTYTLFGTADGFVRSNPDGSNLSAWADLVTGQDAGSVNSRFEGFITFDTSAVVGTITSVTLSLFCKNDDTFADFTLEARARAWTPPISTAAWVPPASQGTLPLLATFATSGLVLEAYNALVSEAAFLSNINQSGVTGIGLFSNGHRTGAVPSTFERVTFYGASAGTTKAPKLIIEALV